MADGIGHESLGRAAIATLIDGTTYQLEYTVIIGYDIRDHAVVQIYRGETIIWPKSGYTHMLKTVEKAE